MKLIDGIKVIVCNVPYSNFMHVPARLFSFITFVFFSALAAIKERNVDLVFATSTPLTVTIPGILASKLKGKPYVFEVRDLWPEDLVAAGRLKESGLGHRIQSFMERSSYAVAKRVVLVSEGFRTRLIERGYPSGLLKTLVLGADGELFKNSKPDIEYLRRHGLENKTIAIYCGAHGNANGLNQVLDAAERLLDRTDIAIVLIGDGREKPKLIEDVRRRDLHNVHMIDPVPKTLLPGVLAGCHVGLMILKQISRPRWVTPNKLFDYMFAGLPVLVNFAGTTADLVKEEEAGIACIPGSADDLAEKIRYFADNPGERRRVGNRGREAAWKKYDRSSIARQMEALFLEVLSNGKHADTNSDEHTEESDRISN